MLETTPTPDMARTSVDTAQQKFDEMIMEKLKASVIEAKTNPKRYTFDEVYEEMMEKLITN